jgi:carboxypeptidase C (cathepsin A)
MRHVFTAALLAASIAAFGASQVAFAADDPKPDAKAKSDKPDLPPFPADASIHQTTIVAGKTLSYTATVGSLPVRDEDGKKIAEIVFTAYTLDGPHDYRRPVTFAFNGGPGAASVYLNLGAIGPKRIQFGAAGDSASDPAVLRDNPGTWLDFTDLVFIDPVGTGFSRSLLKQDETDKKFFMIKPDIEYLSRIVYDWLLKNGRMASPKYVVGESYGGYRAPAIAHELQTVQGVGVSGVVMVSPALDGRNDADPDTSPMGWMSTLPSMAAANYERQGKPLNPQTMAEVETYTRTEFVTDILKGRQDQAAVDRIVKRVTAYTGLPEEDVRHMGGRIESRYFLRALYREQGKLGSWYDSNVTAYDPYPWSPSQRVGDPILNGIIAPPNLGHGGLRHPPGRLEGGRPLRAPESDGEPALGEALVHLDRKRLGPARSPRQRSEDEGDDRPRLRRPLLPLFRLGDGGGADSCDGRSEPAAAEGLSGRAHVLFPPRQPGGAAPRRDGPLWSPLRLL